jgi:hypothetical protein
MKITPREQWADLIFIFAVILGAVLRFSPAQLAGFPVSDGGMFAVMINDLKTSNYVLPAFTTYNFSHLPFAYPPLGFYFGRIAADLFGLASIEALRWVPPFFASLSIPAFYSLARQLFGDKYYASFSTLFFALMPRALSWFVSGGGLTRSPAQFFMLLTLAAAVRLYQGRRRMDILWASLFAGLTVMSHPEAAVHMIASVIFFWAMLGRSRKSFVDSVGVAILALIVSSPWWLAVVHYHGPAPLLSAIQTGQKSSALLNLLIFNFTEEPFATVLAILALVGIGSCLVRRNYLFPLWLVLPFIVEGRSAILPAAIPLAMLAAVGCIDVVLRSLLPAVQDNPENPRPVSRVEFGVELYLLLFLLFSTYQYSLQLSGNALSRADREAMAWINVNTPAEARFLVLTGTNAVTCDLTLEWFPALAQRRSLYTVQGTEWTKGRDFIPYVRSTYAVQNCLRESDVACLDSLVKRAEYDYIYMSRIPSQNCRPVDFPNAFSYFLTSLQDDAGLTLQYESDQIVIFGK